MDDTKLYFNFMSSDANSLAYLASYNLIKAVYFSVSLKDCVIKP
jgi:hypothetical protein